MPEIVSQFPEWNEEGFKPPQERIDSGWEPGDRPPAPWFNWLLYTTSESIQELDQYTNNLSGNVDTLEEKAFNNEIMGLLGG